MYADNNHKMIVVLNGKQPLPLLFNAAIHTVTGLALKVVPDELDLLHYVNTDFGLSAWISRYPNIVLVARNGNQLRRLYEEAREQKVIVNAFTNTMLGDSAEDQLTRTRAAHSDNCEFVAVAVFGGTAELNPLTRRFSLFRRD
jgi:hypothetical protein